MSETREQGLSGVAETLLLPLYNRAMESQRPDAMFKDEKAVELVTRMASFRWMAPIFRLFKPMRIFHFQLGKAAE